MSRPHTFTAMIDIAGINPYVIVPPRVLTAIGGVAQKRVLVRLSAARAGARSGRAVRPPDRPVKDAAKLIAIGRLTPDNWFRTTLVKQRSGLRPYLDQWMRETAGVGVGDRVRIALRPDEKSRVLAVPAALRAAIAADPAVKAAWNALAPSRRNEILTYLNFLRTSAAIERNVRKVVARLVAGDGPRSAAPRTGKPRRGGA